MFPITVGGRTTQRVLDELPNRSGVKIRRDRMKSIFFTEIPIGSVGEPNK